MKQLAKKFRATEKSVSSKNELTKIRLSTLGLERAIAYHFVLEEINENFINIVIKKKKQNSINETASNLKASSQQKRQFTKLKGNL